MLAKYGDLNTQIFPLIKDTRKSKEELLNDSYIKAIEANKYDFAESKAKEGKEDWEVIETPLIEANDLGVSAIDI